MNNGKCKIIKRKFIQPRRRSFRSERRLSLHHLLRVKSAGYWLKLGDADQAIRELEALPEVAWNHPSAVQARVAALGILAERSGMHFRNKIMRSRNLFPERTNEGEVLVSWGDAKLVKYIDGKLVLKGGSKEEKGEAREWLSMFWHEAVVGEV
jgi:hypothetical protein